MKPSLGLGIAIALTACGGQDGNVRVIDTHTVVATNARLPAKPGEHGPSLVQIDRTTPHQPGDVSDGTMLSDVDSCSSCHPDAARQWSTSPHSFASFGNPIYRFNV